MKIQAVTFKKPDSDKKLTGVACVLEFDKTQSIVWIANLGNKYTRFEFCDFKDINLLSKKMEISDEIE